MTRRLFVGNLAYHTTEDTLRAAFAQDERDVESVHIVLDRETGQSRGFAFVQMATDEQARAALEALDGTEIDGRAIRVNEAEERRPRSGPGDGAPGGRPRDRHGATPGPRRERPPGGGRDRAPAPERGGSRDGPRESSRDGSRDGGGFRERSGSDRGETSWRPREGSRDRGRGRDREERRWADDRPRRGRSRDRDSDPIDDDEW